MADQGADVEPGRAPDVRVADTLTPADLDALAVLVGAAAAADDVVPLSEHASLHLRALAGAGAAHLLVRGHSAGDLVAVAHVDLGQASEPGSAELVVRPDRRREGLGSALLRAVEELAGISPMRVWAHGDLPAAQALAAERGYRPVRELWQMTRSLADPLPDVEVPAGFTLRAFRPGTDDKGWLAVNAAAFAHHPEQGGWRLADLEQRMGQAWFDPTGFLLLVDDASGELAGFHWTKVHAAAPTGAAPAADGPSTGTAPATTAPTGATGEVYVVGVSPAYQGRGLAKPLTLAGLTHLRSRGLPRVILYVDGDNTAAVRTYAGLGFTRSALDVQYARP